MGKRVSSVAVAGAATMAMACGVAADSITPGNLVIVRIGGTTGAAAPGFLTEYTTGGSLVQTLNLPTADGPGGNQTCTLAGNATTNEGYLSLSTNGQYLTLAGNDMPVGTTVATSALDRVVARVGLDGAIDTTTRFNLSSGWNARSAVMDGDNIWVSGSANTKAVSHLTYGASSATVITNTFNGPHVAKINDGQLYLSADPNTNNPQGVFSVGSGLPVSPGQSPAQLPGFPAVNSELDIWDFWFADSSTIYFADSRATASGGGLQKWSLNVGVWSRDYTLNAGLGAGLFGVTGVLDGGVATIYATTADNKIVTVTDLGAGSGFSTLVTGEAGGIFRGIVLVPEPGTSLLCIGVLFLIRRR